MREGSKRTEASMLLRLREQLWLRNVSLRVPTARWERSSSGFPEESHGP